MVGFLLVGATSCSVGILLFVSRKWSARMQRKWSDEHLPPGLRGRVWLKPVTAIYAATLGIAFGVGMIIVAVFR